MSKFLIPIALLVLVVVGGYFGYQKFYLAPEKVIARAVEVANKLKTVQIDIDTTVKATATSGGVSQSAETGIKGLTEVNIKEDSQKAKFTMSAQGISTDMEVTILKDGMMYLKMSNFGGKWISFSKETIKKAQGLPVDSDSIDYVSQLSGVLKSVKKDTLKKLVQEEVNGVRTTKYEAEIDNKQYIDYMNQAGMDLEGEDFSDATMKATIWVNTKTNNVIKMTTSTKGIKVQTGVSEAPEATADIELTMIMSKHNESVDIKSPEGEVVKYEDMLQ